MKFILSLVTLGITIHASMAQSSSSTAAPPTTTEPSCGEPCDEIKNLKKELDLMKQWFETAESDITNLQTIDAAYRLKLQQVQKHIDSLKKKTKAISDWFKEVKEDIADLQFADIELEKQNTQLQEEINVLAYVMVFMLKYQKLIPQNYDFNQTGISGLGDLQNITTLAPGDMTTEPVMPSGAALDDSTDQQEVSSENPNNPTLTASYQNRISICLDSETVGITQNENFIFSTCGNTRAVFIFNTNTLKHMVPVQLALPTGSVITDIAYGKSYDNFEILLLAVIMRNEDDTDYISKLMSVNITEDGLDANSLTTLQIYDFDIESTADRISLSTFEYSSGIYVVHTVFNTTLSVTTLDEISNSYYKSLEAFGSPLQLLVIKPDDYIVTTTNGKIYHTTKDSTNEEPYILTAKDTALYSAIYRQTTPVNMAYILVALDDNRIVYIDEDLTQADDLLSVEFPSSAVSNMPYKISVFENTLLVASTKGDMLVFTLGE